MCNMHEQIMNTIHYPQHNLIVSWKENEQITRDEIIQQQLLLF